MLAHNLSHSFRLAREGKGWLAVAPGFGSIETCPFGYALTQDEAIDNLLACPDYQRLARSEGWSSPHADDFIEVGTIDEEPAPRSARPYGLRLVFSR
jgi:hypothetical protein